MSEKNKDQIEFEVLTDDAISSEGDSPETENAEFGEITGENSWIETVSMWCLIACVPVTLLIMLLQTLMSESWQWVVIIACTLMTLGYTYRAGYVERKRRQLQAEVIESLLEEHNAESMSGFVKRTKQRKK